MNPTFHRGAVVRPQLTFKGVPIHFDAMPGLRRRWEWDLLRDHSNERTSEQLAAVSKPSRQRRKGPITRYGVQR